MINNDDLSKEEAELLEKLKEVREKKAKIKRREYAHSIALVEDAAWEATKEQREKDKLPLFLTMIDFWPKYQEVSVVASKVDTVFFEEFKYSKTSYDKQNRFNFRIDAWTNRVKEFCTEHNIKVKWATEEIKEKYLAYKAVPRLIVTLDEEKNRVIMLSRFGDELLARRFYARQLHENIGDKDLQKPFWLPISELGNVFTELANEDGVEWGESAKKRAHKEINLLAELDEIALAENIELVVPFTDKEFILRPFQRKGIKWMETAGYNCLLADQMGLGKTAQSIGLFLMLEKELDKLALQEIKDEATVLPKAPVKFQITGKKEDAA